MIAKTRGSYRSPSDAQRKGYRPGTEKDSDLHFDSKPEDLSAQMEEGFDRLFTRANKSFADRIDKSFDRIE
jgi:hypothetical protein